MAALRKPEWADPAAHLLLPIMINGMSGPWCKLYDCGMEVPLLWLACGDQNADVWDVYDTGKRREGAPLLPLPPQIGQPVGPLPPPDSTQPQGGT